MTSLRFLFDGKRINDDETPKQVNQFFLLSHSQYLRWENKLNFALVESKDLNF